MRPPRLLDASRKRWELREATQTCRIFQPGSTVPNAFGFGENVGERDLTTIKCKVIGPMSSPREVTEGDEVVGLANFEVRLPWKVKDQLTILKDARVLVTEAGMLQTYRVLDVDRGRPDAWFLGLFCVRIEQRTNETIE